MLITVEKFEELMKSINTSMAEDGIEISSRPINAAIRAMQALHISAPLLGVSLEDCNFPITTKNLASHVYAWYQRLYSERLKVDFTQAKFPFIIHGDVFEVRVPLFFGNFLIVSNKNNMGRDNILNAVDMIQALPTNLRECLTPSEENTLQAHFITCLSTVKLMHKLKENGFISSALKDSFVSSETLTLRPKSPDLSAWHSAQFAEKVLKYYISKSGTPVQKTHKFSELVLRAKTLDYEPDSRINWELLSSVTPAVRYEPGSVSIKNAVKINIEAWRVAYNVLHQL